MQNTVGVNQPTERGLSIMMRGHYNGLWCEHCAQAWSVLSLALSHVPTIEVTGSFNP